MITNDMVKQDVSNLNDIILDYEDARVNAVEHSELARHFSRVIGQLKAAKASMLAASKLIAGQQSASREEVTK